MTTYSEAIQARYSASEQEIDVFGRTIVVQRLRPWNANQVRKMADSDRLGVVGDIVIAASVRKIIGEDAKERVFAPPSNEGDIAAIMNALDGEGLEAAAKAYFRLMGMAKDPGAGEAGDAETGAEAAKN